MMKWNIPQRLSVVLLIGALAGCGEMGSGTAPETASGDESGHDHDHDHDHADESGHDDHGDHGDHGDDVHTAQYGGQLVELGDHVANVEIVFDADTGSVSVFGLDSHAENPVRMAAPSLAVVIESDALDEPLEVELPAIENLLTGETVGDTSEFTGEFAALQDLDKIHVTIPEIELKGARFTNIEAHVHATDADNHDHDE